MKIVRVTLDMPYRYSSESEQEKLDDAAERDRIVHAYNLTEIESTAYRSETYLVTGDTALRLVCDIGMNVSNKVCLKAMETLFETHDEAAEKLSRIVDRLAATTMELQSTDLVEAVGWNNKVSSPLSGPVLHGFNDLLLLEDCCTDELQGALDKGWRLVSVNPQEAHRPDYVLGRRVEVRKYPTRGAARSSDD